MTSSFIQPVLSLLQKPEDTESEEIAKQVDADIAAASGVPSKEDEEIQKQVDADIAAAQKPPEELDVFGEKKDPVTKGIEYLQSGIQGMIQSGEEDYPTVNELSKRLQEAGPNKFDTYDRDIVSTLTPKEVEKLLERQPWVYATLTPEQKAQQFKQSRESDISTLGAVGRAVGQVANFGLDLVKAGANYGWDQTYAEGIAPMLDVYNDQMPRDPITGKIKSLTGGTAQVKARERVSADLRNMAGAWANTIIESQRQIERYSGGTGEGYKFLTPSPQKISENIAKSPQAAAAAAMFPMLGPAAAFSPLFLSTKLAEAGKDPNSGYAAFIDQINERLGFQDESMSQKHYDNRKLYDAEKSAEDWNAGQGAELVSPWSKMAFSPVFQYLNLQRNAWILPSAETYAKLKNISVEEAKDELAKKADENAEKGLRALADKMNKEYDPSMELLGGMAMGDAALDVAGIAVGGTRLLGKGISKLETAGMSPAQINALMTARQAREKEVLAQNIANAQKRSLVGKAAKKTEDIQKATGEYVRQYIDKMPPLVKEYGPGVLSQIGLGAVGGTAGYLLNPEDQNYGVLRGLSGAALLGTAGLTPGLLRSIDEARMLRAGGSPLSAGTFEIAGKLPTSSKTTKILFGGKRGAAVDYLTNNFHTLGKAGVNFGAINAINSAINSDSPERFVDSVAEGIAMGVGFKMLGKIHGSDPDAELQNRKLKDVEIYLSRQRQSDATRKNMDDLRNYQNYVDASQMNVDKMQGFLAQAQQDGDLEKIASAQKAFDIAQSVHNDILTANVQTRNEMGRMMDEIYADANSLLNGARKVGQQNVKLEVLTTPEIIELLSKQFPDKSADELVFMANQRGFFIKDTNTSVVNFDKIIRKQQMTGESLTDAFRHEALGHALWSLQEFRDLNKNVDDLLFERVTRDLRGNVVDVKPGKYTENELFDMYSTHYLKGKSPEQINQYAQESGLWNNQTNSIDREKVINAMKDEIRAELIAGNLAQGFGKMKQQSRSIDDWVSLRAKTNLLARAMQNAAGIGAKPFESKLLGISYDPEVVAANRRAIEAMRDYNGEFEDAPETKKGVDIPEKTMRNDPVMRKRYGLSGGEYKTTLYAEVKDAEGNVVGQKVPVTSENAKEGTWVNDASTGQVKQTKGYGQVPQEFAQMQIPAGGSLNIVTDFVYEPDGKTPVRRSDKDIEALNEDRRVAIKNAIDSASDRYTDPRWMKPYSADGESYDGLFSPEQIKNIKNLPESVLPLSIKEKVIALNNLMLMGDGSTIEIDYAARLKGKKYKGRRSEIYSLIPGGKFHLSKATNFSFNAVSRGAWLRKIKARKDRMPGWFNPWGNDTALFEKELQEKYLANTYAKRPGWYGLDPENPTEKTPISEEKWNKFKDFLNMVSKDVPTVDNPWRMKTPSAKGKEGRAEGDIDNLWRQFRLDAIADWADSTDATGRYTMGWENIYKQLLPIDESGESTELKTPEQQRRGGVSVNFMPERMEGEVVEPVKKAATQPERYPTPERGFYSGLQQTIDQKVQGKFASPDQLKAIISNPQNVKAEELKWSGVLGEIDRLAAENQGKVPKDKVMDYLRNEGSVKFEETTLGKNTEANKIAQKYGIEIQKEYEETTFVDKDGDEIDFADLPKELQDSLSKNIPVKYEQYQLPGGENYREVVMTMPSDLSRSQAKIDAINKRRKEILNISKEQDLFKRSQTDPEAKALNDSLTAEFVQLGKQADQLNADIREGKTGEQYTSSHFPEVPNYVAHMRLNERTDAEGNDGLFIEELQSDRHQAGREKGYNEDLDVKRREELRNKQGSLTDAEMQELGELNSKQLGQGIPDAPFRKDWGVQLFKRALRDAVESGKSWIGWTTGIEQVKRYENDMRSKVDEIIWQTVNGNKSIRAIKNGKVFFGGNIDKAGNIQGSGTEADGKQVSDVFGKSISSKVSEDYKGSLTGDDLTIGGEGMKGFYDTILPKEIGKYVAKMGGKVEKSAIDQSEAQYKVNRDSQPLPYRLEFSDSPEVLARFATADEAWAEAEKRSQTPIWRVNITPEMAGKVKGGQLQFMPERPVEQERIVASTYTDPRTGEVREGVNHKAANPNAPDEQTDRESRYYGFKTDTGRVVDREEAYRIAEASGQLKEATSEEDRFNSDRGVLHSNMVEMEPTISEKPKSSEMIGADMINPADIETSAKPATDAVIKPYSNALVSSAGLINFLPAYHGTPHEVDKFKLENIGTGEGAQAYGWGLYFAQAKGVAEEYRKNLTQLKSIQRKFSDDLKIPQWVAEKVEKGEANQVRQEFLERYKKAEKTFTEQKENQWWLAETKMQSAKEVLEGIDRLEKGENAIAGNLYKVDLDVKDEDLLDWDKPLSEQSEKVREKLVNILPERSSSKIERVGSVVTFRGRSGVEKNNGEIISNLGKFNTINDFVDYVKNNVSENDPLIVDPDGKSIYYDISNGNPKKASEALLASGISGIRYLDGTSRKQGEGTYNYVVFDENLIKILDKNDKPVEGDLPKQAPLAKGEAFLQVSSPDIRFMPERPVGKTEVEYDDTYLKSALSTGTDGKVNLTRPIKPNEALPLLSQRVPITNEVDKDSFDYNSRGAVILYYHNGKPVTFKYDPQLIRRPQFKDISVEHEGKVVQLAMADRHTASGGDMGGPMHPWLKSLEEVEIYDPVTGQYLIGKWANNEWKPAKSMKDKARAGATDLLVYTMDKESHGSNLRSIRIISNEIDNANLTQPEKDVFLIIANKAVKTYRLSEQKGTINDANKSIEEIKTKLKKETDKNKISKLNNELNNELKRISNAEQKIKNYIISQDENDFSSIVRNYKTAMTRYQNKTGSEEAYRRREEELKNYMKTPAFKKLQKEVKGVKMVKLDDTFDGRKAAGESLKGLTIKKFNVDHILPEISDFENGGLHHFVASVELSKNPNLMAVYLGDDPEQAKFMTKEEAAAAKKIKANPNFVIHEAYSWLMLGPKNGNDFLNTNPKTHLDYFPWFKQQWADLKTDPAARDRILKLGNDNLMNTMRDQKTIPLVMPKK